MGTDTPIQNDRELEPGRNGASIASIQERAPRWTRCPFQNSTSRDYAARFRWANPSTPIRPLPNSTRVAGSGVADTISVPYLNP